MFCDKKHTQTMLATDEFVKFQAGTVTGVTRPLGDRSLEPVTGRAPIEIKHAPRENKTLHMKR